MRVVVGAMGVVEEIDYELRDWRERAKSAKTKARRAGAEDAVRALERLRASFMSPGLMVMSEPEWTEHKARLLPITVAAFEGR